MRRALLALSIVLMSVTGPIAFAADAPHGAATTGPHGVADVANHAPRPVLPETSPLPGSVLIVIVGMFLAAASIGPVVRYHRPEEPPEPVLHDEHGHGAHDVHGHGAHGHEH